MTIITKPLSEKKGDKLDVPLVDNDQLASAPLDDVESQTSILILPSRAHRVSTLTTLCLVLTALMVLGVGIFCGTYLYDQYLRVQTIRILEKDENFGKYDGWAQIPYYTNAAALFDDDDDDNSKINNQLSDQMSGSFLQEFQIDDDEKYESINVPDFKDERSGRFIHDFNTNITCIIDATANRCFIMPLDRANILPPKSLYDLIHKMSEGYYKIDSHLIRESMRVVTPPITDLSKIGNYISNECKKRPVYKLEKFVSGVVKRSADLHQEAKFAQFAGKGIVEFNIVNIEDVQTYEQNKQNSS